jgi:hypothetical protein
MALLPNGGALISSTRSAISSLCAQLAASNAMRPIAARHWTPPDTSKRGLEYAIH